MSDRVLNAASVGARQVLTLVEHSPTLLDEHGRPTSTLRRFHNPSDFLHAIRDRKDDASWPGTGMVHRPPHVFERTITHLVVVPADADLRQFCVPAGFRTQAIGTPEVTTASVRRRVTALAIAAERLASESEKLAGTYRKARPFSRELIAFAHQARHTADALTEAEAQPTTGPASVEPPAAEAALSLFS